MAKPFIIKRKAIEKTFVSLAKRLTLDEFIGVLNEFQENVLELGGTVEYSSELVMDLLEKYCEE